MINESIPQSPLDCGMFVGWGIAGWAATWGRPYGMDDNLCVGGGVPTPQWGLV